MIRRPPLILLACAALALLATPARAQDTAADAAGLHVDCRGAPSAAPTVIFESGAFGTSADWDRVLHDLAPGGRVCAYDRGGVGQSAPRAGSEDVVSIAWELRALLARLGETRPVILVGHSNGALYIEAFAAMWPKRVAGLVYVQGVGAADLADPVLMDYLREERGIADLAFDLGRLGLAGPLADAAVAEEGLSPAAAARKRAALGQTARLRVARDEDRAIAPGLAVVRELGGSPPGIPTVVISGATLPRRVSSSHWYRAERVPAERARVRWILHPVGATHVSPLSRDRAWVEAAVNWLRGLPDAGVGH